MAEIAFSFNAGSQSTAALLGANSYLKRKDVARDTFFVLVDETSSFTGSIEIVERGKVGNTVYTAVAGTITVPGSYSFIVNPVNEYFVRTATFTGTATGFISDASGWSAA